MSSALPTGWEVVPFRECLAPITTGRPPKVLARDYGASGVIPIVDQGQGLIAGWTNDEKAAIRDDLPYIVFGDHTRLFKFVDFPFALGADGTQLLKPRPNFDARFFYYACRHLRVPNRGYNRHFSLVKELRVPRPPVGEQKRVAAVLSLVQRAIETEERAMAAARELRRASLHQAFIPQAGWPRVALEDLASVISKGSSPRWQGFEYSDSGILFVRSQNVGDGVLDLSDRAYLPLAWNLKERRSVLHAGDVLVNLVGASIGRAAVGDESIEGANCNQAVCFVRLKAGSVVPDFLVAFLLSEDGQRQMHTTKKDIARANLSLEDVRGFAVPLPNASIQRTVGEIFSTINRLTALHARRLGTLRDLFSSLLDSLMTGETRVDTLDIDTSAVEAA